MNEQTQAVVDGYMRRLKRELRPLPRERREEILEDIGGHIDESLGRNGTATEADARTLLDQLGEPSEIADEARERFGIPPAEFGPREIAAVVLLPFGGAIFIFGWLIGVGLLWSSRAWTRREKLIGTLVPPGGLSAVSLITVITVLRGEVCGGSNDPCSDGGSDFLTFLAPLGLMAFTVLAIAVPIWLAVKAHRRAAQVGG